MIKQSKKSLRQLIKSSFFRLTVAVSVTFTIVAVGLIDFTEIQLFIPHLQHDFQQLIHIYSEQPGSIVREYEDSVFYRVDDNHMGEMPDYLSDLDVGHHEVFHNNNAYHIMVKEDSQYRYLFEINQSDFELMELSIIGFIIIAMFISWGVALLVSRHLSKKILDPIQLLSEKIRNLDKEMDHYQLRNDFADDEVGRLAQYFDEYNQKINTLLMREKMFTSDVSHELRTPLMVISSTCELLLTQHPNETQVLKIQSACFEMKNLVSIFLALARNEGIDSKLNTAEFVLKEQFKKFHSMAQQKGLLLSLKINALSERQYSEEFLTIVVSNLIRNAINYTAKGEIKLVLNDDGFTIHDTGPGIPEAIENSVFAPFVRGQTNHSNGMGLGLSIVKRICEKKGWQVSLSTKEKRGTSISINF
ncbi:MAG: HAMP domain-containing histidine kinase [gamma proteobacterium symbiont of Bathyaustriella thionipta]|nr:HAMP domain-containing histidine kinase [gamma proteobacterium symbiont of Bathyaustriella thionipta]MCU7951485.1 HAMP domain-containing histidine kinase [gamma proteobacterium symbiont of Bathyaustriella thionipta]MCU7958051.1 HAMP domain-containing histidine kinase [gamma proteobacterium symbiont of Bathyaustriella thionipta]MCU7968079.1 HAMP domain-containing histidine kinase [gamma proteobacterium symbiont of Bathyaustriella thionipta]